MKIVSPTWICTNIRLVKTLFSSIVSFFFAFILGFQLYSSQYERNLHVAMAYAPLFQLSMEVEHPHNLHKAHFPLHPRTWVRLEQNIARRIIAKVKSRSMPLGQMLRLPTISPRQQMHKAEQIAQHNISSLLGFTYHMQNHSQVALFV